MNISVVVTVYNKEKEISRALQSIGNQSLYPDEIIVVDDGSTDGSAEIVEKIQMPGLKLVRQGNTGVYGSRNRGIIESQYELVAFLDGDDTWEPEFLAAIEDMRRKYPACGIYSTAYQIKTDDGEFILPRYSNVPLQEKNGILENYFIAASKGAVLSSSSVAIPKKVFDDVGMFTVDAGPGGDKEMWVRIAVDYPVAFDNKVLATWHKDASNRVSKICHYRPDPPCVTTGRSILSRKDLPDDIRRSLSIYLKTQLVFQAAGLIISGRHKLGRKALRECGMPSSCPVKWLTCLWASYLPRSIVSSLYNFICQTKRNLHKFSLRNILNNHYSVKVHKELT